MFNLKLLIILLLIGLPIRGQPVEVVSNTIKPCYVIDHIQISTMVENVEAVLGKKIQTNNKVDTIPIGNKILYTYHNVVWRMEVKDVKLDCPFINDIYWENDIRVIRDGNKVSITDTFIWNTIVKDTKVTKKK